MNIQKLLSTKERMEILTFILYKTNSLGVSDVARDSGLSKGLVSRFFDILIKENILKKNNNKFLVQDNLKARILRIFLSLNNFDVNIFRKYRFVKGAGLFGSLVKGKNTEKSDIDLWILVDKAEEMELARLTNELKKKYGNIKTLYLTEEKMEILKKEDTIFYYSLVFGSINIYGEEIETI